MARPTNEEIKRRDMTGFCTVGNHQCCRGGVSNPYGKRTYIDCPCDCHQPPKKTKRLKKRKS